MAKIEEKVFENELDTGLIRSTCFISIYNSMNKSRVMEPIDFSYAYLPKYDKAQGTDIITCLAPVHYSTETWALFSPLF